MLAGTSNACSRKQYTFESMGKCNSATANLRSSCCTRMHTLRRLRMHTQVFMMCHMIGWYALISIYMLKCGRSYIIEKMIALFFATYDLQCRQRTGFTFIHHLRLVKNRCMLLVRYTKSVCRCVQRTRTTNACIKNLL